MLNRFLSRLKSNTRAEHQLLLVISNLYQPVTNSNLLNVTTFIYLPAQNNNGYNIIIWYWILPTKSSTLPIRHDVLINQELYYFVWFLISL